MELKNALGAWKKAKPLTLTKTGVSEALRPAVALVEKGAPKTAEDGEKLIVAITNAKRVLATAVADKRIKAEKKALDCLQEILKSVAAEYGKTSEFIKQKAKEAKAAKERARQKAAAAVTKAQTEKADAERAIERTRARIEQVANEIQKARSAMTERRDQIRKENKKKSDGEKKNEFIVQENFESFKKQRVKWLDSYESELAHYHKNAATAEENLKNAQAILKKLS